MNLKSIFVGVLGIGIMMGATLVPAFAAGSGNWDPSTDNCNAGHGVFQYFSDPSVHFDPGNGQPPYFGDDVLGSARKGITGENNSSFSEYCKDF